MKPPSITLSTMGYVYDAHNTWFQLEGTHVKAKFFTVEHDPHHFEEYTVQIITECGQAVLHEGRDRGSWPLYMKELFRQHKSKLREVEHHGVVQNQR